MTKTSHVSFLTHAGVSFEVPIEVAYNILLAHFFDGATLSQVNAFHDAIERWRQENPDDTLDMGGTPV